MAVIAQMGRKLKWFFLSRFVDILYGYKYNGDETNFVWANEHRIYQTEITVGPLIVVNFSLWAFECWFFFFFLSLSFVTQAGLNVVFVRKTISFVQRKICFRYPSPFMRFQNIPVEFFVVVNRKNFIVRIVDRKKIRKKRKKVLSRLGRLNRSRWPWLSHGRNSLDPRKVPASSFLAISTLPLALSPSGKKKSVYESSPHNVDTNIHTTFREWAKENL